MQLNPAGPVGRLKGPEVRGNMVLKGFMSQEGGSVAAEYVIFVAAVGILLIVGVGVLFGSLSGLFGSWANYFNTTGT